MKVDTKPGRYHSETKKWYFSCDEETAVLVGMMEPKKWTCPVLGLVKHNVTWAVLGQLFSHSESVDLGSWSDCNMHIVPAYLWNQLLHQTVEEEKVAFIETDSGEEDEDGQYHFTIIRLHMAME
jgi:hypothetical protein